MPLPVIADVVRVTVFGTVEGGVGWSNTFHLKKAAGDTYAQAITDALAETPKMYQQQAYGAGLYGWAQYNSDASVVNGATYTPLDGSTASISQSLAINGVSSQAPLPAQNSMSVTLQTALRGRSHRGRVFWSLTSREVLDSNGKIAAADIAGTAAMFVAYSAALAAKTHPTTLVVASYKLAQSFPVGSVLPRSVAAHQTRRRGRGA